MVRHLATITRVLMPVALLSCGGGGSKKPTTTSTTADKGAGKTAGKAKETEADREKKRHSEAISIIPDGSSCLPAVLKEPGAPRLDLETKGQDLIVCASDTDKVRLLGPVACWKIDLGSGALTYQAAAPIPGRGIAVKIDDRCARGYCLPKDAKDTATVAHMAWNGESSKVALLVGDDVHIYDGATKAHESSFTIRGAKGVTGEPSAVHWAGDAIIVESVDDKSSAVFMFKLDGTALGAIEAIGSKDGKPMSTHGGSFSLLDKNRIAVSEQGFTSMTVYEVDTSKRSKLVRKLVKPPCKNDELDAYWKDNTAAISPKCKDHMSKNFEYLIGATAVATAKSFLVMMRGARTGEIGVLDQKTLAEKKVIKLPWCGGGEAAGGGAKEEAASAPKKDALPKKESAGKKAAPKSGKTVKGAEDPDAGGQ